MLYVDLPNDVTARLRRAFSELLPVMGDTEQLLVRLLQASALLPVEKLKRIMTFRASQYADSAMLVSGLPIDEDLPPTPVGATAGDDKKRWISECAILAMAILLGEPVAYRAEKNGSLVQNVYPIVSEREMPSNESSAISLDFHTELTFSRNAADRPLHVASPDFVLLLCLRCPPDRLAQTTIADAAKICALIENRHLETLRTPQFQLRAPYSFTRDDDGSRPWSPAVPLLRGPETAPSLAFDVSCGVRALSPDAESAIEALAVACNHPDVQESVQLRPGDLLAVDNNRCAHARSPFPAYFDGNDRWLQRVYVRRGIWPIPAESDSAYRVLV
jgi:L-asparagine oxygenase